MESLGAKLVIVVLSVLLTVTPTLAEVVYLKDGTTIEGRIERIVNKEEVLISPAEASLFSSSRRVRVTDIRFIRVNPWTVISPDSLEDVLARSKGRSLEEMFTEKPTLPPSESQTGEQYTENELEQQYNRSKLSIELEGAGIVTHPYDIGLGIYSNWRTWKAYQGFAPMSEENFFVVTGYPHEADEARRYRESHSELTAVGVLIFIGGLVMAVVGYSKKEDIDGARISSPDWALVTAGGAVSGVGVAIAATGITGLSKNWAPYSAVQPVADDYNRKLMQRLQEGSK
jgi:hypothetical protein